ncbi:MAG: CocE/NonD family hydrolase [Pseudomonadota bacterium]
MREKLETLRAAWPMLKRALKSGQLLRPQCELYDADPDVLAAYDVSIPMPDGYHLTANIFKSQKANGAPRPTVMCAHPYDNRKIASLGKTPFSGPPLQYRLIPQADANPRFSKLASWESPDPGFWVPAGYNLVNLNLPGYANSGGPASIMSAHQGQSYREAISWVAQQTWSDGAVGLCGVSFLCISQYLAAAVPEGEVLPPALKCMIPWEGVSDLYHDLACRAGVADTGFLDFWWHTEVKESINGPSASYLAAEEAIPTEILGRHPLYDEFWRAKAPPLENITVPMLVGASFSDHELHTMGTFRTYEKARSRQKWLYTHRGGKWAEFYHPDCLALQKRFMDHFLKGQDNEFAHEPSVRLEVRSDRKTVKEIRWETQWPLLATRYQKLYLSDSGLSPTPTEVAAELGYDAKRGEAVFETTFQEDIELSGYMMLKLWAEVRPSDAGIPDDMVLCCYVDKLDWRGDLVRFNGSVGVQQDVLTRGYCRASRRALNIEQSTDWLPVPAGDSIEPLSLGQIVPLHIALCPSSTFFLAGEKLRVTISGRETVFAPIFHKVTDDNDGQHILHFGAEHDSHLLIPRITQG